MGVVGMKRLLGFLLLLIAVSAGAESGPAADRFADLLRAAQDGDARAQNLVGVMLVRGEGVPTDPATGHAWLHKAAEQNYAPALRNLGVLHAKGDDGVPIDYTEANAATALAAAQSVSDGAIALQPAAEGSTAAADEILDPEFDDGSLGERVFQTYCAGCHGFNGIAVFPVAPSFALGDRMYKADPKLLRSVMFGKGAMPSWGDKLSEDAIAKAIGYLRSLSIREEYGLVAPEPDDQNRFFRFVPMGSGVAPWEVE